MPESAKTSLKPAASKALPVRPPDLIYDHRERHRVGRGLWRRVGGL